MTSWTLARRSLGFYIRSHLGTIAGAAIATAVLTGALVVGDSVRESLRQMALARLGKLDHALVSGDRLFRSSLAGEIEQKLPGSIVVAALQLPGSAVNPDTSVRANQVQVIGVAPDFWRVANDSPEGALTNNTVWINDRLARHLKVAVGDTVLFRIPRVSNLSRDAPLSPEEDSTVALRLEVTQILDQAELGSFGLQASQVPPFNAFVPLPLLQDRANATDRANLLLANNAEIPALKQSLEDSFQLSDAQITLLYQTNVSHAEFRTARVFLDQPVGKQMVVLQTNAQPIFTYFVNQLRLGDRATPYSMVTATTDPLLPADLQDNEIVINQWLADDLGAKPGDELAVAYYVMGAMRDLIEKTNTFRVRSIVPMELPYADPTLMPDFPGMTDADNCRDWDTGFPIDTEAIRDKDEAYWDEYRGTPKAFITLAAGQEMWANRFGNLTAVRYPVPQAELDSIRSAFEARLQPENVGMVFEPIRAQALAASTGAQDFGGLFIGFSFFLIAAALMLMALLFRFALEQRGLELGTLLALGFPARKVKRLLLLEGTGLALIGSAIGVAGGVLYARTMLHGLTTIWRDAIGSSTLGYHATPQTLLIGFFAGALVALVTIWWSLRHETKRTARELLSEGLDSPEPARASARPPKLGFVLGSVCLLAGIAIALWSLLGTDQPRADLFFMAGALVLIAGILFSSNFIRRLEFSNVADRLSLTGMGIRSVTRRRKRSRATIALLACGAFLITSIGAFRLETGNTAERSSGTGGFAFIGESSIPVVHNLNAQAGRDFFNLSEEELSGVSFVPLRVLEGDDASCLNLNRAQQPRVLGVNPHLLAEREAFTFARTLKGLPAGDPWLLLNQELGPNIVPAIGDAASIQYAMGKKLGDTLTYLDHAGREFQIKIVGAVANSILQGNLLISEQNFIARFPGQSGYRMFFIDAPSNRSDEVAETLSRALQDTGFEVTSARDRLAAFNAVQNTYLGTFQLLGGLGLLLGSLGLGIVLLRNVFERRSELALLLAVGFRKPSLRWLILSEHAALLAAGLCIGIVAAVIAILPSILSPGARLPLAQLGLTLGAVLICGLVWTMAASALALRAPLLKSLRNE